MRTPRLLVALVALVIPGAALRPPPPFPVMCRGGGKMEMRAHRDLMLLSFKGAPAAANRVSPSPGECAWLDREWRPGEPTALLWWTGGGVELTAVLGPSKAATLPNADAGDAFAARQAATIMAMMAEMRRRTDAASPHGNGPEQQRMRAAGTPPASAWVERLQFDGSDDRKAAQYTYLYHAVERGELFQIYARQSGDCRFRGMPRCLLIERIGP